MFFIIFFILFPFWLVFSGKFDFFHITLGVISCCAVAFTSKDLFKLKGSFYKNFAIFIKLIFYFPWIVFEIIKANIDVSFIILSRKILDKIDPIVFTYKTTLKNKFAQVIFANSITLTPGTVTMSLFNDELVIHALTSDEALEGVKKIEKKLLDIFKD